jgi:formylglycine-generating enzyme required for sulfatase activity
MITGLRRGSTQFNRLTVVIFTAIALLQSLTVEALPGTIGPDPVPMVTIPAGEFLMGSPEGKGRDDERPQRSVYLDEFTIDQVEVTNERYMAFVKSTGHRTPPNPYGTGPLQSVKGIEQLPVVQTTWYDAKAYCSWAKKRLPTEAEWLAGQTAASFPGEMTLPGPNGQISIESGRMSTPYTRSDLFPVEIHPTE